MLRAILMLFVLFATTIGLRDVQTRKDSHKKEMNVGLILPYSNFGVRIYTRAINSALSGLHRARGFRMDWLKMYNFTPSNVHSVLMTLTPSPTGYYYIFFNLWSLIVKSNCE